MCCRGVVLSCQRRLVVPLCRRVVNSLSRHVLTKVFCRGVVLSLCSHVIVSSCRRDIALSCRLVIIPSCRPLAGSSWPRVVSCSCRFWIVPPSRLEDNTMCSSRSNTCGATNWAWTVRNFSLEKRALVGAEPERDGNDVVGCHWNLFSKWNVFLISLPSVLCTTVLFQYFA